MKEYKLTAHYGDYIFLYDDKGYQYKLGNSLDFGKGYLEDSRLGFIRLKIREHSHTSKSNTWILNFKSDISLNEMYDALMSKDFEIVKMMMDIIINNEI